MNTVDAICMTLYFLLFATSKTKDSLVVLLAFVLSVCYTSSSLFYSHPAFLNHLLISIYFIPAMWFLSKWVFFAVLAYSVYHWVVAFDYIFYNHVATMISSTFYIVSPMINAIIMATLIYVRRDGNVISTAGVVRGWLPDFLHSVFNNKKLEKK